jgi:hypothetical protein
MLFTGSCAKPDESLVTEKVSTRLVNQIELRKAQIDNPTPERLTTMQALGMNLDPLQVQRIFIHLNQPLTQVQVQELEGMGIKVYLESWIPPVGSIPTGYLLADIPADKLAELSRVDYVVNVDTAERQFQPQNNAQPQ